MGHNLNQEQAKDPLPSLNSGKLVVGSVETLC